MNASSPSLSTWAVVWESKLFSCSFSGQQERKRGHIMDSCSLYKPEQKRVTGLLCVLCVLGQRSSQVGGPGNLQLLAAARTYHSAPRTETEAGGRKLALLSLNSWSRTLHKDRSVFITRCVCFVPLKEVQSTIDELVSFSQTGTNVHSNMLVNLVSRNKVGNVLRV